MTYKTDLQSNNTDLQSILDMILALGLVDAPKPYLTFKSDNPFSIRAPYPQWDGIMYYSLDKKNWAEWDGSEITGNAVYVRGEGNTIVVGSSNNIYRWYLTGTNVNCEGNIETLLDWETAFAGGHPAMAAYCYSNMFYGCTSLITAPELPATTLAKACYYSMFNGCTSLTAAPSLPATTLADSCYANMFIDCTILTAAPELPATTLANQCYASMFGNCTGLTTAPKLPATTLAKGCYYSMFGNCTGLTTAPKLPATMLEGECYYSMFGNCTSLTTVPELPATTLAYDCYYYMFNNCTSLKLSRTQTAEYTKTYRIPTNGTGTTATSALQNMFGSTGGTFTGTPSINTTYYLHSSNTIV